MTDNLRIEDLRRRIQKDPASIAFAQLAEEHRRAGDYEEAIRVCRVGLAQHPSYLSARVTLGRALVNLGRLQEAGLEFAIVLESAPDNVVALRALADIHQRTREMSHSREQQRASEIPVDEPGLDPAATASELTDVPPSGPKSRIADVGSRTASPEPRVPSPESQIDPVLAELEAWLEVIGEKRSGG